MSSPIVPSAGAGLSAVTLCVITSALASYLATCPPGWLSHFAIVPSVTLSPSCGMLTVSAIEPVSSFFLLIRGQLAKGHLRLIRSDHVRLLQRRRVRHRRYLEPTEAHHRSVQVVEAVLRNDGRHLRGDADRKVGLLQHQDLAALAGAAHDRGSVERAQCAQVDDLALETVGTQTLGCLEGDVHHHPVREHGDILSVPHDLSAIERNCVVALRDLALDGAIRALVLEIE